MNTLAHLAALIALLWATVYAFGDLGQAGVGYALLAVFLLFLPLTVLALQDDIEILRGRREE